MTGVALLQLFFTRRLLAKLAIRDRVGLVLFTYETGVARR